MPSAATTLITMRAPTVLKSTSSTKPCSETMRMRSSTGAATRAVRSDIDRKPANSAAMASESAERQRPGAAEPRERREESDHQRRQPQDRLAVGRQIERDAAHRRDRNP